MNLSDVALLAKEELSLAEKGIASAKLFLQVLLLYSQC